MCQIQLLSCSSDSFWSMETSLYNCLTFAREVSFLCSTEDTAAIQEPSITLFLSSIYDRNYILWTGFNFLILITCIGQKKNITSQRLTVLLYKGLPAIVRSQFFSFSKICEISFSLALFYVCPGSHPVQMLVFPSFQMT